MTKAFSCLFKNASSGPQRILGGQLTTINNYPYAAVLLNTPNGINFVQECGGVILSVRSVLTAAHCIYFTSAQSWRVRVGSSYASSGGNTHTVSQLISHPQFDYYRQNDVGIIRISSTFAIGGNVQLGRFAGEGYVVADDQPVRTIGWGSADGSNSRSEQLRFVNIRTVNQEVCRSNYNIIAMTVLPNTMCAGIIEQRNVGPCYGDYGGPLIHGTDVVLGIASWDAGCGYLNYPTVYTRVPHFIAWIQSNA
ncbi:unnamed protein product, partial [Brenthis ino]